MADQTGRLRCQAGCWITGSIIGLVGIVISILFGGLSVLGALFVGALVTAVLGVLLSVLLCKPLSPPVGAGNAPTVGRTKTAAPYPGSIAPSASTGGAAATAPPSSAPASAGAMPASSSETDATSSASPGPDPDVTGAAPAGSDGSAAETTSSGFEEDTTRDMSPEPGESSPAAPSVAAGVAGAGAVSGTPAETGGETPPTSATADTPEAAPDVPTDGDRPVALDAPREGGADDLKQIKGIGPKLEKLLHSMGFYHFDQVAGWTDREIAWVDANLEGFKGRATRDDWVGQARTLADGGSTSFSEKVKGGDVY